MNRYSPFKESRGKSYFNFKGTDQVGSFYVVTQPTERSTLEDIFFESNAFDFALSLRGGLEGKSIVGIYTDKNKANKIAQDLLKK